MTTFKDLVPSAPEGRFDGIERPYTPEDVAKLRGSVQIQHTLAERGAVKLWELLKTEPYINALGALSGNQAMQMVRAGLKAIYLSGWQVAADANTAGAMYPDQSLYPANSAPELAKKINRTLQRADQIEVSENGKPSRDWFAPIVADAEAGFGGTLNCFEIMKAFIEAGASGVHFEDQVAAEKKCGHLGGKVLIPTQAHIRNLTAARLAADVMGVPSLVICRTVARRCPRRPDPRASETQPQASAASPPRKTTSFSPIVVPSQTMVNDIHPSSRKSGQGSGSMRPSWRKVDKRQGKHKDKYKDKLSRWK